MLKNIFKTKSYLCFPHIAKTGGTSLNYHFRQYLGKRHVWSHGGFARMNRFLDRKPQLEEMAPIRRKIPKVIQGHGVKFDTFFLFPDAWPNLICVFREPVSHFYSRFNHWSNFRKLLGYDCSLDHFIDEQDTLNFQSTRLLEQFLPFAEPVGTNDKRDVLDMLSKFKYLFATEHLDAQVTGLFNQLRIPLTMEKRRVASNKLQPDITPSEIADRNPIDCELYEHIRDHRHYSDADGSFNPFGFDKESLQNIICESWKSDNPERHQARIANGYAGLVNTLRLDRRLEVAREILRNKSCKWITQPKLLRTLVEKAWSEFIESDPGSEALSVSSFRLAHYFQHNRNDIQATTRLYERSLDYWPDSPMTLAYFGEMLVTIGKREAGVQMILRALELEPKEKSIQDIANKHLAG